MQNKAKFNEEAAQELAGRQMREIINLNAEHEARRKRAAEAAQRRQRANKRAEAKAAARAAATIVAGYLLLGMFAVWVLGYLVGAGEGKAVLMSLTGATVLLLAAFAGSKIRAARRCKKGAAA